jgi:eukaryotic-like serine/threonine-protein kinase
VGRRIKFGPFELDRQTGELWKNGAKVRLQGKPFQILVALLERPGQPVSREELQQRLWNGDTFVDFDSGLNTAANRLRLTLGDSAESPRYVETLARSGYRFVGAVEEVVEAAPATPSKPARGWLIATALAVFALAALWWVARRPTAEPPRFQQITFRRGAITGARFTPDGQNVLYSAKLEKRPWEVYLASSVSPETRSLGFEGMNLNAVSRSGELLLLSSERSFGNLLSRVPMNGGSPLALASRVTCADWSPDGKNIAAVRMEGNATRIEFPLGKRVYRTPAIVSCLSVSPDGNMIAFGEHPVQGDDGGDLKVLELNGKVRTLSAGWAAMGGLAWAPSGKEVWFTAARTGSTRALWAVTLGGKLRLVARVPGSLRLEDISRNGRVLLAQQDWHVEMAGRVGNDAAERDLTWFDWTGAADLSADGNLVLFDESGDGGGPNWTAYLHRISDGSTLRLGEGHALALAPDGRFAAILNPTNRTKITIVPVGAGQPREISGGIEYQWARYFPDGQQLLVAGDEPGGNMRLYLQAVNGGKARPLSPDIFFGSAAISPDGKWIAGADQDARLVVVARDGAQRRIIPTANPVQAAGWSADSNSVLVRDMRSVPAQVSSIDLATGRAKVWREIGPANLTGVQAIYNLFITPDLRSYVYSFDRMLVKLYLAEGLK